MYQFSKCWCLNIDSFEARVARLVWLNHGLQGINARKKKFIFILLKMMQGKKKHWREVFSFHFLLDKKPTLCSRPFFFVMQARRWSIMVHKHRKEPHTFTRSHLTDIANEQPLTFPAPHQVYYQIKTLPWIFFFPSHTMPRSTPCSKNLILPFGNLYILEQMTEYNPQDSEACGQISVQTIHVS